jgi:hypothetical protein
MKYNGVREQKADVLDFSLKSHQHSLKIEEYYLYLNPSKKAKIHRVKYSILFDLIFATELSSLHRFEVQHEVQ